MTQWPLNLRDPSVPDPSGARDPLRLCVNATVALITCVLGPVALLGFAGTAIFAYAQARRAGLMTSRCRLGDTRLVLAYLIVLAVLAAAAIPLWIALWTRMLA
ncbi:hypothetical protein [Microbacterium sp.]|uniref:hypothetical protein n=1 Tax=Microbacterium sp. TaxID=51671 RepID=UPI0039E2B90F